MKKLDLELYAPAEPDLGDLFCLYVLNRLHPSASRHYLRTSRVSGRSPELVVGLPGGRWVDNEVMACRKIWETYRSELPEGLDAVLDYCERSKKNALLESERNPASLASVLQRLSEELMSKQDPDIAFKIFSAVCEKAAEEKSINPLLLQASTIAQSQFGIATNNQPTKKAG